MLTEWYFLLLVVYLAGYSYFPHKTIYRKKANHCGFISTCSDWSIDPSTQRYDRIKIKLSIYSYIYHITRTIHVKIDTAHTQNKTHRLSLAGYQLNILKHNIVTYVVIIEYKSEYKILFILIAPSRARTGDLSVNSRPLCQLSQGSIQL